jgi:hypothetical protein
MEMHDFNPENCAACAAFESGELAAPHGAEISRFVLAHTDPAAHRKGSPTQAERERVMP